MKIHALEGNNDKSYRVAIHFTIPVGDNPVGFSWKDVGMESGTIGSTILKVGVKPSNITQEEYDSIIAGDIVEIVKTIYTGTATNASVEALADIAITEAQAEMSSKLAYYGHTIN